MTARHRIEIAQSERRQKVNELLGVETRSAEQQTELETLTSQLQAGEVELRAAIAAEPPETRTATVDSETRELRALQGRAELRNALERVVGGNPIDGAESELAQARGLRAGNMIPFDLLDPGPIEHRAADPDVETRADVTTTDTADINAVDQHMILRRVFARSGTATLGVGMQNVPIGERVYPVLTGGAQAEFVAADAAKDAQAATFDAIQAEPRRLQSRYKLRVEDTARIMGFEPALRADLGATMRDRLDAVTLGPGDAQLRGFLATLANGGLAATDDPNAVIDYEGGLALAAAGVDGRYGGMESECAIVVGAESYRKLATVTHAGSGTTASRYLTGMLRAFMASANIPAASNAPANIQEGILARLGAAIMAAVCPMWQGITLIRDEITGADEGHILITARALYSFKVLYPAAFTRLKLKLA